MPKINDAMTDCVREQSRLLTWHFGRQNKADGMAEDNFFLIRKKIATVKNLFKSIFPRKKRPRQPSFYAILDEFGYYAPCTGWTHFDFSKNRSLGFSMVFAGTDFPAFAKKFRRCTAEHLSACRNAETNFPKDTDQNFESNTFEIRFVHSTSTEKLFKLTANNCCPEFLVISNESPSKFFDDATKFHHKLIDAVNSCDENTPVVYATILAPQGFFIHDFFRATEGHANIIDAFKLKERHLTGTDKKHKRQSCV